MKRHLATIIVCTLLLLPISIDALGISTSYFIFYTPSDASSLSGPMDSPWPMQSHDVSHTGQSPYSTANNNGAELWKFKTIWRIEGGIALDKDGILYFGDLSNFYAVYPNGTQKWKVTLSGDKWITPALAEDGTIYVGSFNNHLCAFNPNGTMKWSFDALSSISSSSAIAEDGTIYFGTMGWADFGCRVYAVNPNGTLKWYYQTTNKVISSPAIGTDGTVYIGSLDRNLYAFNPNGTVKWSYKTDGEIHSNPSIGPDGIIYFGSNDFYLYAVYPNGTLYWKYKINGNLYCSVAIGADGTIYCPDHSMYALFPDGSLKWQFDFEEGYGVSQSSPALSKEGTIYVGASKQGASGGYLYAINPDGTERWKRDISNYVVESSPAIGADGTVYIGSTIDDDPNGWFGYVFAFGEGNVAPETPTITGPQNGKINEPYTYSIYTTDLNNDHIFYYVDWGDGTNSGWLGQYSSGSTITVSHFWSTQGSYAVKAKAKDEQGLESDWATLEVTMPKSPRMHPCVYRFLDLLNHGTSVQLSWGGT